MTRRRWSEWGEPDHGLAALSTAALWLVCVAIGFVVGTLLGALA